MSDSPIEQVYKAVLEKMSNDRDGQHTCRVLFQDIRDYLEKNERRPEKVSEQEIMELALTGILHQMGSELSSYETVIANAEIRAGLPQALAAVVRERMHV